MALYDTSCSIAPSYSQTVKVPRRGSSTRRETVLVSEQSRHCLVAGPARSQAWHVGPSPSLSYEHDPSLCRIFFSFCFSSRNFGGAASEYWAAPGCVASQGYKYLWRRRALVHL